MLQMQNISKIFRTELVETHALREFNLTVNSGEFVTVTGPSGSGKSSLAFDTLNSEANDVTWNSSQPMRDNFYPSWKNPNWTT